MWPFKEKSFAPPPVPQQLREILKDYPELIQVLQDDLNSVITDPMRSAPPFEVAVWRLKDALDGLVFKARDELAAAEASGNADAIGLAERKVRLMLRAGSTGMRNLSELQRYFGIDEGAFK